MFDLFILQDIEKLRGDVADLKQEIGGCQREKEVVQRDLATNESLLDKVHPRVCG